MSWMRGQNFFYGLCIFVAALAASVLLFEIERPFNYLAGDSFAYFAMARQFHDSGLLFSYSGVDHTTGAHPGYYFLLVILYPLFGLALPQWSFVINGALIGTGLYFLYRGFGTLPALVVFLVVMTPFGARLTDNGMESSLLFLGISLLAWFFSRDDDLSPRRMLTLGGILGFIIFARLDTVFLAGAVYAVLAVAWIRERGVAQKSLSLRGLFLSLLPCALVCALIALIYLHYGGASSRFPAP